MIPAVAAFGRTADCPRCMSTGGVCPHCGDEPDACSGDAWECDRCDSYFSTLAPCLHLSMPDIEARAQAVAHVAACPMGCSSVRVGVGMVGLVAAVGCDSGTEILARARIGDEA